MSRSEFGAAARSYGKAAGLDPTDPLFSQLQKQAKEQAKAHKKLFKKELNAARQQQQKAQRGSGSKKGPPVPRPSRPLPASLGQGNCRFDVGVTAPMAHALAVEMLGIPLPLGCDDAAVRAVLESYEITEEMKRMQLRGRKEFFRKLSQDCPRFNALYEQFIKEVSFQWDPDFLFKNPDLPLRDPEFHFEKWLILQQNTGNRPTPRRRVRERTWFH